MRVRHPQRVHGNSFIVVFACRPRHLEHVDNAAARGGVAAEPPRHYKTAPPEGRWGSGGRLGNGPAIC
eukprot:909569-Pyramimonas_sp.AAC.1